MTTSGLERAIVKKITRRGNQVVIQSVFHDVRPGQSEYQNFIKPYHVIVLTKDDGWGEAMVFQLVVEGKTFARTIHTVP